MTTVYGITNCPACVNASNFLKEKGAKFNYINLEEKPELVDYVVEKTGVMSAPQIEFSDGTFLIGFNRNKIEEKLKASIV